MQLTSQDSSPPRSGGEAGWEGPPPQPSPRFAGGGSSWLRSARWDLSWFILPGLLAVALVLGLHVAGVIEGPHDDLPPWAWLATVVAIDVAHVWATLYRVYLDPVERERRALLYTWLPAVVWLAGAVLYACSSGVFWSVLAYVAVFHFVRQQEGFVKLYRRKAGERDDPRWDTGAVWVMTLYPILYWHAHLPRSFHWFRNRDFVPLPLGRVVDVLGVLYWCFLIIYLLRTIVRRQWNPGKWGVLLATWACWYVGIVPFDSDLAFTITNVVLHGVPYLGLVLMVSERKEASPSPFLDGTLAARLFARGVMGLVLAIALLLLLAYGEEALWDGLVWHEHGTVFGTFGWIDPGPLVALVVPFLSIPQATHYLLDGVIWKLDGSNPGLRENLGLG